MNIEISEEEQALLLEGLSLVKIERVQRDLKRVDPREIAEVMKELAELGDKIKG